MIKLLEEKYQKKVIIYNDMYLFFNSVAKDFIRTCKNYNIHIDSLDAFSITYTYRFPRCIFYYRKRNSACHKQQYIIS